MDTQTRLAIEHLQKRIRTLEEAAGLAVPRVDTKTPKATPLDAPRSDIHTPRSQKPQRQVPLDPQRLFSTQPDDSPPPVVAQPDPEPPPPSRNLEHLLGAAVLGRLGIAAIVLAAGYFAQLAYRHMTDLAKVGSLYGVALLLYAIGHALRSRTSRGYVSLIWGGAIAIAYLAGIAARLRYELVSAPVAMVLLVAASALGQYLAFKIKHKTLATVALAGAFAAPLLVQNTTPQPWFLCAYLLLLHSWSAWCERRWNWGAARLVGVVGLCGVAGVWLHAHGAMDVTTYACCHLYVLGCLSPELLDAMKRKPRSILCAWIVFGALLIGCGGLWAALAVQDNMIRHRILSWYGMFAGLSFIGLALLMPRCKGNGRTIRQSVASAGLFLFLGGAPFVHTALGLPFDDRFEFAAVSTAVVALLAMLAHKEFRTGYVVTCLGATVSTGLVYMAHRIGVPWTAFVAGVPIVSLVLLRKEAARVYGFFLGLGLLGLLAVRYSIATELSLLIAVAGVYVGATMLLARARRDATLAQSALACLLGITGAWVVGSVSGAIGPPVPSLVSAGSLAGWALIATSIVHMMGVRRTLRVPKLTSSSQRMVAACVITMGYYLLRRETLQLFDTTPEQTSLIASMTVAFAAAVMAWLARGLRSRSAATWSFLFLLWAALRPFLQDQVIHSPSIQAWHAVCFIVPAVFAGAVIPRRLGKWRRLLPVSFGLAAVLWGLHALDLRETTSVLNPRFLSGIALVAGSWFTLMHSHQRVSASKKTHLVLAIALLAYLVGTAEVKMHTQHAGSWSRVLMSLYTALFSGGLLAYGFRSKVAGARYVALAAFGLIALKVGLYDLAEVSTPLRILVTGGLGAVFLVSAYAYTRPEP